ncbi:MAG: ACP S-malonyltransferase [Legionella sp.]
MHNIAFVFPGQGSQCVGMLNELANQYPLVKELFTTASECLGFDLWHIVQHGPEEKLNQTKYTQVAMLVADVAIYQIIQQQATISARMMAGHSLGEYAALVCAQAITFEQAVTLVAKRAQLMQDTVPAGLGAMAAIVGFSDDQVEALCEEVSLDNQIVSPANYNAVGQVVIAGHYDAVVRAINQAHVIGARLAKIIPVSVPCHCLLLTDTARSFASELQKIEFNIPTVPVISNVDLSIYNTVPQIKSLLAQQLYSPVRWVETIALMKENGVDVIIECGPGKVLSGLIKRIDKSIRVITTNDSASLDAGLITVANCG